MRVSVVDPVGAAFERMKLVLFQPFDFTKWLVLGFCAFLAYLGQGGGGVPSGNWSGGQGHGPSGREIADWVESNIGLIIGVGLGLFCIGLLIGGLLLWLSSRGKFMFLDGVVRNRGAVAEPWKLYAPLANNLFGVRLALAVLWWLLFVAVVVISAYVVWPDLRAEEFGDRAIGGLVFLAGGILVLGVVFGVVGLLIEDFVAPAMYQFGVPFGEAWGRVSAEVIGGRVGTIVLYVLMKIVLGIAIGVIAMVVTCVTCCAAAIPYVGTVILLPVYVFLRCYSLCFLEQLGPEWRFFVDEAAGVWVEPPPAEGPGLG